MDILIKFIYRLRNKEEFENIVNKFEKNGYRIHEIEYKKNNFEIEMLVDKCNEISLKENKKINIVIISNVEDVLFNWAKLYPNLGQYIFFIDNYNYNLIGNKSNLNIDYNSIMDKEEKIYININFNNLNRYFDLLIENNNFESFEHIDLFDYNKKMFMNINKQRENIKITEKNKEEFNYLKLIKNRWFLPFVIYVILKEENIIVARNIFIEIYEKLKVIDNNEKIKYIDYCANILKKSNIDYRYKIGILSLNIVMEAYYDGASKYILEEMLKAEKAENKYSYMIISNLILSISKNNLIMDKMFYDNIRLILKKSKNYYKNKLENEIFERTNKKIFIVVDVLKDTKHSGTRLVMDIIKNMNKYYPEYEIKIFVEDNFYGIREEDICIHSFSDKSSQPSLSLKEEHIKLGIGNNIEYAEIREKKEVRINQIIESISEFKPEVLIYIGLCSYSLNFLYEYYPTMVISLGSPTILNDADFYLTPHIKENIEFLKGFELKEFDISLLKKFEYGPCFEEKEKKEEIMKKYKIEKKDFIMVTVGHRLNQEIDLEFYCKVINFMKNKKNIKWFIVGDFDLKKIQIDNSCEEYQRVINIKKIENLGEFYRWSNVYINPLRNGGGYSIAEAIINNVPVLSEKKSAAGKYYCGENNCICNMQEYIEELEKIYVDKDYLRQLNEKEKKYFERFDLKKILNELIKNINNVNKEFLLRKNRK